MNTNETKTATNEATKTATKTNKGKEGKKTMNATKNTPAANEVTKTAEAIIAAAEREPLARKIAAAIERAKTAATKDARAAAAEEAAAVIAEYNRVSFENAARRASFIAAAEAVRVNAPKKDEARKANIDYTRRAEPIQYTFAAEDGTITLRTLSLPAFAVWAFKAGKTATHEQRAAFGEAIYAIERYQKNAIEKDGAEAREGLKEAAAAITSLVNACGIDKLTTKTAENGFIAPFFVHRSFVNANAARMKCNRGVYTSHAAAVNEAAAAVVAANDKNHERAAARLERAEAAAVKMVFSIINEAAAAAVVGVWNASVLTVSEAEAARHAREAEAARKAREAEAAKKAREAAKAKREAEREALKKEREAKKAATPATKTTPAAKTAAKKTTPAAKTAKKTTPAAKKTA